MDNIVGLMQKKLVLWIFLTFFFHYSGPALSFFYYFLAKAYKGQFGLQSVLVSELQSIIYSFSYAQIFPILKNVFFKKHSRIFSNLLVEALYENFGIFPHH